MLFLIYICAAQLSDCSCWSALGFCLWSSSLLFLTFHGPTWLTLCLRLFRCSQQQWPSSRLVRSWCRVSFFVLRAVRSILQLSSLRSRQGKSGTGGKKEREEEVKAKANWHAPRHQLKWISFRTQTTQDNYSLLKRPDLSVSQGPKSGKVEEE